MSMIFSTFSGGSRAMAEERASRAIRASPVTIARRAARFLLLGTLLALGTAPAAFAAPPDETCHPGQTFAAGGFDVCAPPAITTGGGGIELGGLLPILLAVVVGAGLAVAAAYFVLRRRAGGPLDPVDAGEWWTCPSCGRQNMVGSPRCYSCGTWQGGARPDKRAPER
jgi:hypothetical protein